MLQSNSDAYGVPETVNLTEICPSEGLDTSKLLVNALGGRQLESTIKQKLLAKMNLQLLNDSTTKLA